MVGRVGVSPRYLRRLLHDIEASAE
jgi:hypothetical protein